MMRDRKAKPDRKAPTGSVGDGDETDKAFDIWLQRGLHRLYDNVADQPIPDELLRLIEEDRKARGKQGG